MWISLKQRQPDNFLSSWQRVSAALTLVNATRLSTHCTWRDTASESFTYSWWVLPCLPTWHATLQGCQTAHLPALEACGANNRQHTQVNNPQASFFWKLQAHLWLLLHIRNTSLWKVMNSSPLFSEVILTLPFSLTSTEQYSINPLHAVSVSTFSSCP